MILRRIALRFSLNRSLISSTIDNSCKLNESERWVHSSNVHEIDYLVSRYRLTNKNTNQSYGQKKSSLAYFNTIDDFSYKSEKEMTSDSLKNILNINKLEANQLVRNYPILTERSAETLEKQFNCLSSKYYIKSDQFLSCPWILYLPFNFINERLEAFSTKDITNDYLVLLLFPFASYKKLLKKITSDKDKNQVNESVFDNFNKRLIYFTENLNINDEEFCDLIHDNMFLFKYEFKRLENIMELLFRAGIDSNAILGDINVFMHNIELMQNRIKECEKWQMPVKTWMLRSTKESFEVSLQRHIENKRVLKNHENSIEYLATELKCDKEIIHYMMKRYPRIVSISAKKLSETVSFLFKNGFSTYHIVETPKILFHKVHTIKIRMKELTKINVTPNALKVLTLSDSEYRKLLDRLNSTPDDSETELLKSQISN